MSNNIEIIKIDYTEIFLDDRGNGQGKITISNTSGFNFSCYWGAMGGSLRDFLLRINEDYFVRNLAEPLSFDAKLTAKGVRKYVRNELKSELPWYMYMEFQKGFRQWIKGIENIGTEQEFVDYCFGIRNDNDIDLYSLDRLDRKVVESILESHFETEPWYFIEKGDSKDAIFLKNLFRKLQTKLKSHE